MTVKLVTVRHRSGATAGLLLDSGRVVDLGSLSVATGIAVPGLDPQDTAADPVLSILARWDEARGVLRRLDSLAPSTVDRGDVQTLSSDGLGPPILRPGKIIGVGLNYADHAAETGQAVPSIPVLFAKFPTSIVGPGDVVVRPAEVEDLDYEAELGVVIGQRTRDVNPADALRSVAGYLCANDVSARTAQVQTGQWVRGKSFDTFCPIGPALVDAAGVPDPQGLDICCSVDGDTRQQSNTREMIFTVAELVSFCSRALTLEPGDLILTGTPPGVAMGRSPSPWLQPGQSCTVEIEGLGRLTNPIG